MSVTNIDVKVWLEHVLGGITYDYYLVVDVDNLEIKDVCVNGAFDDNDNLMSDKDAKSSFDAHSEKLADIYCNIDDNQWMELVTNAAHNKDVCGQIQDMNDDSADHRYQLSREG